MSLKLAAQYLQTQGRGNDSQLMHISPRELKGLQALAKAKGGSLTMNPTTGLPEAGFLEDVLPIAGAAALMYFAPMAAPSIGAALGIGEGALATGVGMGLLSGGASAATQLLTKGNIDFGQTLKSGLIGGASGAAMQGLMGGTAPPTSDVSTLTPAAATYVPSGGDPYMPAPASYIPSGGDPYMPAPNTAVLPANVIGTPNVNEYGSFANFTEAKPSSGTLLGQTPLDPTKTGLSGKEMLGYGLAGTAALSLLGNQNQSKIQSPSTTTQQIRPYTYSQTRNPAYGQPGQPYFIQSYTAQPPYNAAAGGLMSLAGGGMGMDQNIMYPGSQQMDGRYAIPSQMPQSSSVINAGYEPKTDPFNGQMMASGGETKSNPVSQNVLDYNKLIADRATNEYVNSPQLSPFLSAPKPAAPVTPVTPEAPAYDKGAAGLYQYYLGRKPAESELAQWNMDPNAMATPEQANYFNQFTSDELAKSKYKTKGQDPFLGQSAIPMSGPTSPLTNSGLPQYTYNAATRSYVPVVQSTPFNFNAPPPPPSPMANNMDMGGQGKAGGLMPYDLGGYSDGGRLLKGPGDGMSDNIPASIGNKQPARLADGEFVVPADVVSHLGNGSTDAGAKHLYAMMDKVRTARTGNKKQGKQIKSAKYLPT
jgi:hypothetical protein